MKFANKYQPSFFVPREVTFDWARKFRIDRAPLWCSVDLFDTNQSLVTPMTSEEKTEFFKMLCAIGFKEICIGAPCTSQADFDFARHLISEGLVPDDVSLQVVSMLDTSSLEKTFESVRGAKRVIVDLYNSSPSMYLPQGFLRDSVAIKNSVIESADYAKRLATLHGGRVTLQYTPEFFTLVNLDFSLEICNAVIDVWQPSEYNHIIINLPTAVENAMPHLFACQVEYIIKNLKNRRNVIISVHPHNDRGCAVSDAEFAMLAGADRVEGTLFGGGERAGSLDIITAALNLYVQGVEPNLNLSDMNKIVRNYEQLTRTPVNSHSPYAGSLVFTSFADLHRDAVANGLRMREKDNDRWNVPFLTIDPADLGRQYKNDPNRINFQSDSDLICHILKRDYGYSVPEKMKNDFALTVSEIAEAEGVVPTSEWIHSLFVDKFINNSPIFTIPEYVFKMNDGIVAEVSISFGEEICTVSANGNGRLDAVSNAIKQYFSIDYEVIVYEEHAVSTSSSSKAAAYVGIKSGEEIYWGVGLDEDIIKASVSALIVAVNQLNAVRQMSDKDNRMVAILNFIQTNFVTVTLDSLSSEFFLSKPYLSKYIKEHSGITFGETVKNIRMEKAKTLLKNKGMTVESISRAVGYDNVEHFNRLFKKLFKMTPVQYRNSK